MDEPRFTFGEVEGMIDKLLAKPPRGTVSAALRKVDFSDIAADGHTPEGCKELIQQLVDNTRKIRNLQEVLSEIRQNLKKRSYTELIARASIRGKLPKRPPSGYLLYHQDRYRELQKVDKLACEASKIVAHEWNTMLTDEQKNVYLRKHDKLMKKYESEMKRLGLVDAKQPKRPKSAKRIYIDDHMSKLNVDGWSKEHIAKKREKLGEIFESLSNDDKKKWQELHDRDVLRWEQEQDGYMAAHPHLPGKKMRTNEKIKPPEPPRTPFKIYMLKKMPENLEGNEKEEFVKGLKEKFQNLPEKKLIRYIKSAIKDREKYEQEVKEFNKENPDRQVTIPDRLNVTKEQMKIYSKLVENRPKTPPRSAYLYFCYQALGDQSDDKSLASKMKSATELWRKLTAKEKEVPTREYIESIKRYIDEMTNWLANQPEERQRQIYKDEPTNTPEFWKQKLQRVQKNDKK